MNKRTKALEKAKGGKKLLMTGSVRGPERLHSMLEELKGHKKATGLTRIGDGEAHRIRRAEGYNK